MQYVTHDTQYVHPFMYDIDNFYKDISDIDGVKDDSLIKCNHKYDNSFIDLFSIFKVNGYSKCEFDFIHKDIDKLDLFEYNPKNIIVCCSGGKDSTATILHYVNCGYNVTLFHVENINRGFYGESQAIQEIAKKLNLNLIIDRVTLKGYSSWTEHPMKNIIIANLALSYGVRNKLTTKIAFGNFTTSSLVYADFDTSCGDCPEMWDAYIKIIRRFIPKFRMYISSRNVNTTFKLMSENFELVPETLSCISPYRFRNQFKQRTEKNYNIKLMKNRCGCCWKCCMEYIRFADSGNLEMNEKYYLHCIEILHMTMFKETDTAKLSLLDVWDNYILYPIEKSKIYKTLKHYEIINHKVVDLDERDRKNGII